ncbi:glycosyltransferase family 2 protein, partial [bacterium]|nr:glycosyltransferase family 2 protein [bacterium]
MAAVDITVVIVNYNVRPFLNHCLQSVLRAGDDLNLEVIVVDNASSDESAEMVAQNYPEVVLLVNQENVGFAKANNQAFRIARGEAVLILNPDSFVQTDTLRTLFKHLREVKDIGAIGPKILLPDGRFEPRSMRGFPTPWAAFSYLSGLAALFPRSAFFNQYLPTHLDREQRQEVDALSGCCMMVRRDLLVELQGFDEDYFMYGEDLDLCYRIQKRGHKIIYEPSTRIVHFKGESTRRSNIDRKFHFRKAMRLFVDKNLTGNVSRIATTVINVGFWFQEAERRILKLLTRIAVPLVDVFLLNLFILLGRLIRFEEAGYNFNVWLVNGIYSLFYISAGLIFEAHGRYKFSGRMALYSAGAAAFGSAAFTYFF